MDFTARLESDPSLGRPQKLFFLLFALLFLVAPFYYQPNLGGEGLYIPHNSALWILVSWIIATASFQIYRRGEIILPQYWLGMALLPAGAFITGLIADNNNPTEWSVRISVITGGYLFFLSLFQFRLTPKQIDRSLYLLMILGLIAALYAVVQVFTGGLDPRWMVSSKDFNPVGPFQQVNIQASFMATTLTLCFYLISRPTLGSMNGIVRFALLLTILACSYILILSGSRVGLVGGIAAFILLLAGRWSLLRRCKVMLSLAVICMLVGGALGSSGLHKTVAKLDRLTGAEMSGDIRWSIYSASWALFTEAPLTGHGIGSFQSVFQEKRAQFQDNGHSSFEGAPRFSHPHNELFFWLVEGGVIGIIGIIGAALVTLLQFWRIGWQRGCGYAALLLPITFHSQVELPFYISTLPWLLLIYLLFLTHQHGKVQRSTDKLSGLACRLIPTVFCLVALVTSYTLGNAQIANAALVKYYSSGQQKPALLQHSLRSWYFQDHATYLLLRRQLFWGIQEKKPELIERFIPWAEQARKLTPVPSYYMDLAHAYDALGKHEQRVQILNSGLRIYPQEKSLLKAKEFFRKKDQQPKIGAESAQDRQQATPSQSGSLQRN